jgi:YidC/Oxa1 family membrane protein insertase
MEGRRMALAILLSIGVFILFTRVIIPRMADRPGLPPASMPAPAETPIGVPAPPKAPAGQPAPAAPVPPTATAAGYVPTPALAEEKVVLETPGLHAELSSRGAALRRLRLKRFAITVNDESKPASDVESRLLLLDEFETGRTTFQVHDRNGAALPDLRQSVWEVVKGESSPARAVFRYARADGIVFTKVIAAGAGDYLLAGSLSMANRGAERTINMYPEITGAAGISSEGGAYYISGVAGYEEQGRWTLKAGAGPSAVVEKPVEVLKEDGAARLRWLGSADKYFAAVLIADPPAWGGLVSYADYQGIVNTAQLDAERGQQARAGGPLTPEALAKLRAGAAHSVAGVWHLREFPLAAGASRELAWRFFAGPKEPGLLAPYADAGLDTLVDYGFLSIRRVMLWLLLLFHGLTRNFGVAIILLTFAVRLALFPISRKAQVSMFRMQKLAPLAKAIQERLKDDPNKMRAEMMALYKKHKVNPAGGCLPLLLQMPIFIGLYNTLLFSIELRHAPFAGWIRDLSAPDELARLPFTILGQTHLNLLPILMLVPMVVQTAMSPKPADPQMAQQQKMMTWMMPLMFLFMCYTMPAGVSLYWFFSSLWGLVEIRMIKKFWLKDPPAAGPGAPVPAAAASR